MPSISSTCAIYVSGEIQLGSSTSRRIQGSVPSIEGKLPRISCHLLCLTFLVPLNFFFAEYIKLLSYMSHMYSRPFSLRWFECTLPIEICGQQLWEYWYLMIFILVYCSKSSSGSRSRSHRSSNVVGQFFCFWMVLYGIHLRQNETPHRVGNRTESRCIIVVESLRGRLPDTIFPQQISSLHSIIFSPK